MTGERAKPSRPAALPAHRRARVLVVEQDTSLRRVLRTLFLASGFECHEVSTMTEALIETAIRGADVVLLDLGVRDLGILRPDDLAAPVVVMVDDGHQESAVEALESGAVDRVAKPIEPGQLLGQVNLAMRPVRRGGSA